MKCYKNFIYLGNDLNDYSVMKKAGYSYATFDAHDTIKEVASYVFKEHGGNGFVRAFIEKIIGFEKLTKLNKGELDTANLVEWLAVDQLALLKNFLKSSNSNSHYKAITNNLNALPNKSVK